MWLLNTGRSTFHWWLRLMVAAFLLSAWVTAGLASGIAHADDPSPSGSKSSSESSAGAPKAAKVPPKRSAQADEPGADPDRKAGTTTKSSPSESKPTADETATDSKPPVDGVQPSAPASVVEADPDDPR
jgi:hypothetical protein